MPKRVLGLTASSDTVMVVDAEVPDAPGEPITILMDTSWRIQKGNRAQAYAVLHQLCADYARENKVDTVLVKASAVPQGSARLALLTSAEVRGVVLAAAASVCSTKDVSTSLISRTFGDRKVSEYVQDDDFWASVTKGGSIRKSSREAAMLIVASRGER